MSHRFVLLLLILWGFDSEKQVQAQPPIFLGEDLVFYVSDSLATMRGVYHFLNPTKTAIHTNIFYPFPVSDSLPFPGNIDMLVLESGEHLHYQKFQDGLSVYLEMEPQSQLSLQIEYWQPAQWQMFTYILTSTQKWGRALEWANYEIHVSDHLQLEYCSLDWDSTWAEIETTVYSISKTDYLPRQDLKMRWGIKE